MKHRPDRSILLVGPMCVGKSTVLPLVARELQLPAVDLDEAIVARAGRAINELFAAEGESGFRRRERAELKLALGEGPAVIAAGGGALLTDAAWRVAREAGAIVVSLEAEPEVLARREEGDTRPLLREATTLEARIDRFEALARERDPSYARSDLRVDASQASPDSVATEVAAGVRRHAERSVAFALPGAGHQLILEEGDLAAAVPWLLRVHPPEGARRTVGLVADGRVFELHGQGLREALSAAGYEVHLVSIPPGEACKTWENLETVLDALLRAGLQRGSLVLGLGGGSATDLAGLAAALLKRGCPLVQLPTTVLGMIDAALGGKTAVNHPLGKNLIGAFHQPDLVVACLGTLGTLPEVEHRAALGEVAKYALLEGDAGLAWADSLVPGEDDARMVLRCARQKARCVVADPREGGERIHLNLGHTLGHALEPGSDRWPPLRHGEAVGLGLLASLRLATHLGLGPAEREERLEALLSGWGLPVDLSPRLEPSVWARLETDKKARGGALDFVLPTPEGVRVVSLTSSRARGILVP